MLQLKWSDFLLDLLRLRGKLWSSCSVQRLGGRSGSTSIMTRRWKEFVYYCQEGVSWKGWKSTHSPEWLRMISANVWWKYQISWTWDGKQMIGGQRMPIKRNNVQKTERKTLSLALEAFNSFSFLSFCNWLSLKRLSKANKLKLWVTKFPKMSKVELRIMFRTIGYQEFFNN